MATKIDPNMDTGLTQEQVLKNLAGAGAGTISNGSFTSNINNAKLPVTTAALSSSSLPTPPPTGTDTTNYSGITGSVADKAKTMTEPPPAKTAPMTEKSKGLLANIEKMLGMTSGKEAYSQEQMKATGATESAKRIKELNAQIQQLANETTATKLGLEGQGRGIPQAIIGGQQRQVEKENAIKSLTLSSALASEQGNYENAKADAERAVNLKFKDTEDQIDREIKMLGLYSPFMSDEQKAIADQRAQALQSAKEDTNYNKQLLGALINDANTSGQSSIASKAMLLDPKSPTFTQDLSALQGQIVKKASGTEASGLTTRQNINLSSITTKYQADKVINAAQSAISAKELANNLLQNPSDAGAQLTTLYTFIKALDPESAVREGELSLVNSTQSYLSRFGTELQKINNNIAISPESAKQLARETIKLADQWDKAAVRRDKFYQSQSDVLGVGEPFKEYLSGTRSAPGEQKIVQSKFDYLAKDISMDDTKKEAYLPRSVWASVTDKDALLKEVADDGYKLLIK